MGESGMDIQHVVATPQDQAITSAINQGIIGLKYPKLYSLDKLGDAASIPYPGSPSGEVARWAIADITRGDEDHERMVNQLLRAFGISGLPERHFRNGGVERLAEAMDVCRADAKRQITMAQGIYQIGLDDSDPCVAMLTVLDREKGVGKAGEMLAIKTDIPGVTLLVEGTALSEKAQIAAHGYIHFGVVIKT